MLNDVMVGWAKPPAEYVKVNVDGAVHWTGTRDGI